MRRPTILSAVMSAVLLMALALVGPVAPAQAADPTTMTFTVTQEAGPYAYGIHNVVLTATLTPAVTGEVLFGDNPEYPPGIWDEIFVPIVNGVATLHTQLAPSGAHHLFATLFATPPVVPTVSQNFIYTVPFAPGDLQVTSGSPQPQGTPTTVRVRYEGLTVSGTVELFDGTVS